MRRPDEERRSERRKRDRKRAVRRRRLHPRVDSRIRKRHVPVPREMPVVDDLSGWRPQPEKQKGLVVEAENETEQALSKVV